MNLPHEPGVLLAVALAVVVGGVCGWLLRGRTPPTARPPLPAPPAEVVEPSAESREESTVGSLVAGLAHEVRNPLFSISATLDAFESRFGAAREYQPYTSVLRSELHRISSLIEQLLEYGRPSAPVFAEGRLGEVLRRAVEDAEPQARQYDVTIRVTPGEAGPSGSADPPLQLDADRLVRALRHLLQNAIQFSPPGGSVIVHVGRADSRTMTLIVQDSGPGLPHGDPGQVFEPFFSRRQGGAGLGLAIARRIAGEHGGTLTASNRLEGGACLELRLPLATSTSPTPPPPHATPDAPESSATPSTRTTSGAPQG